MTLHCYSALTTMMICACVKYSADGAILRQPLFFFAIAMSLALSSNSAVKEGSKELLLNTARNVNRVLQLCTSMDRALKEQAISIKALQDEMAKMKSIIKAKHRSDYTIKKAGHEVMKLLAAMIPIIIAS